MAALRTSDFTPKEILRKLFAVVHWETGSRMFTKAIFLEASKRKTGNISTGQSRVCAYNGIQW